MTDTDLKVVEVGAGMQQPTPITEKFEPAEVKSRKSSFRETLAGETPIRTAMLFLGEGEIRQWNSWEQLQHMKRIDVVFRKQITSLVEQAYATDGLVQKETSGCVYDIFLSALTEFDSHFRQPLFILPSYTLFAAKAPGSKFAMALIATQPRRREGEDESTPLTFDRVRQVCLDLLSEVEEAQKLPEFKLDVVHSEPIFAGICVRTFSAPLFSALTSV